MARNLENSTSENYNIQEMGPRRSTRLNVIICGATPPLRGSTMATTMVGHYDNHPWRGTWHQSYGPSLVIPSPRKTGPCRPNPSRAQCVAKLSPSLTLMCATCRATCSRLATHSSGPACFRRAAHSRGPACFC